MANSIEGIMKVLGVSNPGSQQPSRWKSASQGSYDPRTAGNEAGFSSWLKQKYGFDLQSLDPSVVMKLKREYDMWLYYNQPGGMQSGTPRGMGR